VRRSADDRSRERNGICDCRDSVPDEHGARRHTVTFTGTSGSLTASTTAKFTVK